MPAGLPLALLLLASGAPDGLVVGGWEPPGSPHQQLDPSTWAVGEAPRAPHWSDVPLPDTRLVCELCRRGAPR